MSQAEMKWGAGREWDLEQLSQALQKNMNADAYYYLEKRGVNRDSAEQFRVGFVPARIGFYVADEDPVAETFENRVVIPLVNGEGEVVDLIGRSVDHREPKYRSLYGIEDVFFQESVLEDSDDVILCNGIFDVMVLQQAGLPGICLPNMLLFKEVHAERLKDKRVFICMGNDETGRRESVRLQSLLASVAQETFIVQLPESVRDINDLFVRLQQPVDVFVKLLNHAIEETIYAPMSPDIRNMTVFNEEYIKRFKGRGNGPATGLAALDRMLNGTLPDGLSVIAGPPGLGKTTLLKQIADRTAALQQPVLYISWDLSPFELWAVSIARVLGVPYGSVLRGEHEPEAVHGANQIYMQAGKMQWTLECGRSTELRQIEAAIERIHVVTGKNPVVFVDPLHRFLEADEAGKAKGLRATAYQLKEWSRDWNVPVIAALPAERPEEVTLDIRASADLVLALEASGTTADGARKLRISSLKNRSGASGTVFVKFYENRSQFTDALW
ncbi:DnaB-like helicase C-terminal domain-containing protein [Gorillibacterium sp. sgz5001074]|uniref:DnaB-like helicase C-terminal domain-containing protein n=1 Tax=Gorillibacterium sp. sgz5001074 TaxID=3446695 RepID=UPI003F67183D